MRDEEGGECHAGDVVTAIARHNRRFGNTLVSNASIIIPAGVTEGRVSRYTPAMTRFTVNNQPVEYKMDPRTPLLWALRDASNLTGTKYGCGTGDCGACTVDVDGELRLACQETIGALEGTFVTTIEGLSKDRSHPVQQALLADQRGPVRLLHPRHGDGRVGVAAQQSQPERGGHQGRDPQHLPLRHLSAADRRDHRCRPTGARRRSIGRGPRTGNACTRDYTARNLISVAGQNSPRQDVRESRDPAHSAKPAWITSLSASHSGTASGCIGTMKRFPSGRSISSTSPAP